MKDGSVEGGAERIRKAIELAARIAAAKPQDFTFLARSEQLSARDHDVKDLYLLRHEITSRDAVHALEKLLVMIYDRTYFPEEPADSAYFGHALDEFKSNIDPQVARWKTMVGK